MSINWKPGDVAIRKSAVDGHTLTTVATTCFTHKGHGLHWHHVGGGWDPLHTEGGPTYRPLVVIDPEDYGQAQRLRDLIDAAESATMDDFGMDEDGCRLWAVNAVRIALREFANPTPPKPEEPTGLGAVVEDAEGRKWMRAGTDPGDCWRRAGIRCSTDGIAGWTQYADIAAVRVLSEGVQA